MKQVLYISNSSKQTAYLGISLAVNKALISLGYVLESFDKVQDRDGVHMAGLYRVVCVSEEEEPSLEKVCNALDSACPHLTVVAGPDQEAVNVPPTRAALLAENDGLKKDNEKLRIENEKLKQAIARLSTSSLVIRDGTAVVLEP